MGGKSCALDRLNNPDASPHEGASLRSKPRFKNKEITMSMTVCIRVAARGVPAADKQREHDLRTGIIPPYIDTDKKNMEVFGFRKQDTEINVHVQLLQSVGF